MTHAARANGFAYWVGLSQNTAAYYVKQRRWAALFRALWLVVGRGYYLEVCQLCGRRVGLVWHAPDLLYRNVAGEGGIYCPGCFDDLAAIILPGMYLVWTPRLRSRGGS